MYDAMIVVVVCEVLSIILNQTAEQFKNRLECDNGMLSPKVKERYKKKIYTANFLRKFSICVGFCYIAAKVVLCVMESFGR